MKHTKLITAVMCNFMMCIVNASEVPIFPSKDNNTQYKWKFYPGKVETYNDFMKVMNWTGKNIKTTDDDIKYKVDNTNTPLIITNNNLNRNIISILHALGVHNYCNNSLLHDLQYRYKTLSTIQNFYKEYRVLPSDLLVLRNIDGFNKVELIKIESKIANIIEKLDEWFPHSDNMQLKSNIIEEIKTILLQLNDINKTLDCTKYYEKLGINEILQANSDPVEILQNIIKYFNSFSKLHNRSETMLQIYDLSIDDNKYK